MDFYHIFFHATVFPLPYFVVCLICLLTALYQAPHLEHKMLVLKDVVFRFLGALYSWILQSDLTLPYDLDWPVTGS